MDVSLSQPFQSKLSCFELYPETIKTVPLEQDGRRGVPASPTAQHLLGEGSKDYELKPSSALAY